MTFPSTLILSQTPMSTIPEDAAPPVAWRVKDLADGWVLFADEAAARREAEHTGALLQPLYAAPPAPDGWVLVPRDAAQKACADMLDRIIASMETMTRPMMLDWLNRERAALSSAPPPPVQIASVGWREALTALTQLPEYLWPIIISQSDPEDIKALRSFISSAPPPPSREGWLDEDTLTDILTDSLDMDWNPRDGAKAILRYLERTRHERS